MKPKKLKTLSKILPVSQIFADKWQYPALRLLLLLASNLMVFTFCMACEPQKKEKITIVKEKTDTTKLLLESLRRDSSDRNFMRILGQLKNDSLCRMLLAKRRKMFLRYESFQKLKLDSEEVLRINPCYAPLILKLDRVCRRYFTVKDLLNESFKPTDYRAQRFVLGDFNTIDRFGNCRGCEESYPDIRELPELKKFLALCKRDSMDLKDDKKLRIWLAKNWTDPNISARDVLAFWKNLRDHVERFRPEPMKKDSIIEVFGRKYCIGQRLCLCELRGDTIVEVARFVASSRDARGNLRKLRDFDGQPRYYAPMNRLTTRFWDSHLPYDSLDYRHDRHMGFGSRHVILYQKKVKLPNFMSITADAYYPGAQNIPNGIHEFAEGGRTTKLYMGAPVSYGCIRLHDYPSKFTRWWTPAKAKFFTYFENKRYKLWPVRKKTDPVQQLPAPKKDSVKTKPLPKKRSLPASDSGKKKDSIVIPKTTGI